ncbi:MAG TPA: hypothetical protein VLD65_13935 [Anaerolineales bacterium]|nr:hypothetical protein [Anaerolineales bacterium]
MRALIFELRPESLHTDGLVAAWKNKRPCCAARAKSRSTAHLAGGLELDYLFLSKSLRNAGNRPLFKPEGTMSTTRIA